MIPKHIDRVLGISVVIALEFGVISCQPPPYTPRGVMGIDFSNADRPVMLSVGPVRGGARVEVYRREGNISRSAFLWHDGSTLLPIPEALWARIHDYAQWVQIESAEYTAEDGVFSGISWNREVTLIARAHSLGSTQPITDVLTAEIDRDDQRVRIQNAQPTGEISRAFSSASNHRASAKARVHP